LTRALREGFWQLLSLNNVLQLVGASTGLLGNYLITQSNAGGFLVWMVSNVALVWLQVRLRLWILVVLFSVYLYLCFEGIAVWYRKTPEAFPPWFPLSTVDAVLRVAGLGG
jgi:hypothetical protein